MPSRLRVLHSCGTWVALTENWLRAIVAGVPNRIEWAVACKVRANEGLRSPAQVFCAGPPTVLELAADYFRTSASRSRYLGKTDHLRAAIQEFKPHVVHSHFGPTGWRDTSVAERAGIPHVVSFYGSDANVKYAAKSRWADRYCHMFEKIALAVCEGPVLSRKLIALGCRRDKVSVSHIGIDVHAYPFIPRRWVPQEPLRIFAAGRFTAKKGMVDAIRAVEQLSRDVDVQFTIMGDADASDEQQCEKALILRAIENANISSRVRLLGFRNHQTFLAEALQSHIFLAPSITSETGDGEGGLPVSLIELAATGMPIVSTCHDDIPELIVDRVTGALASEGDVDQIVGGLRWLTSQREHWPELGTVIRRHVENHFSSLQQGANLARLYEGLQRRGSARSVARAETSF